MSYSNGLGGPASQVGYKTLESITLKALLLPNACETRLRRGIYYGVWEWNLSPFSPFSPLVQDAYLIGEYHLTLDRWIDNRPFVCCCRGTPIPRPWKLNLTKYAVIISLYLLGNTSIVVRLHAAPLILSMPIYFLIWTGIAAIFFTNSRISCCLDLLRWTGTIARDCGIDYSTV